MKNNNTLVQLKCLAIFWLIFLPFLVGAIILHDLPWVFFVLNLTCGLLAWTYFEYHGHRFLTHNKRTVTKTITRHVHHHKHPTEIKVTPRQRRMLFSIGLAVIIAAIIFNNYFTILAGFILGFVYSFFSHWILHQRWSRKIFPHLHRFHIHHHCKHPDRCFGFSTVFWDVIFGTRPPKGAQVSQRIIKFYYGSQ